MTEAWRILTTQNVAVASAAGAANSIGSVGSETYAVRMVWPGVGSSTGGVRVAIGSPVESVIASSTTSTLLAVNFPNIFKVTPGSRISVISNDAVAGTLTIVELTK